MHAAIVPSRLINQRSFLDVGSTADGDAFEGGLPRLLTPAELSEFSALSPARSVAKSLLEWVLIVTAIVLCERYWNPALYVLTVMWVGARQHALGILMHDGSHYRFHPNRFINDLLSEPLTAWPMFVSVRGYRNNHFPHHRHVNTPRDPDLLAKQFEEWEFPMRGRKLGWVLLRDVLGLNTLELVRTFRRLGENSKTVPTPLSHRLLRLGFYAGVAVALTALGGWKIFFLYWAIPFLTWFKLVLRVRGIAEHFQTRNNDVLNVSRTTLVTVLDRAFIASNNINYHLEHHLFPSVPYFRLGKLHAKLMENPEYRARAHVTRMGYLGVLRECLRPVGS